MDDEMDQFQKFQARDSEEILCSALNFVPRLVTQGGVYKSFLGGIREILKACARVLKNGTVPTPRTVLTELLSPLRIYMTLDTPLITLRRVGRSITSSRTLFK